MKKAINRRQFVAAGAATVAAAAAAGLAGCSSSSSSNNTAANNTAEEEITDEKVVFVWEPNESTATYDGMREAVQKCIETGGGVPCEMMTTTDYNITIESLVSAKAAFASLGASEYVEAHAKNPSVTVAFVQSDAKGELNPVSYYSQICVRTEDADSYKDANGEYSLEGLKGKKFSFVNLNSTSGFVLPATVMSNQFGLNGTDDLAEGGKDKFFSEVLFPGSHPGSLYNLVSGDADGAVFANYLVAPFVEVVSGAEGEVGSVFTVKEGVDTPLDKSAGASYTIIGSLAVPAVPICVNEEALSDALREKIIDYMCSDEVAANEDIFPSPDSETVSNWKKQNEDDKYRFVKAEDSYYDDFRTLIGFDK